MVVDVVVDETVRIAIQTAPSLTRFENRRQGRRQPLRCLDIVGAACVVQGANSVDCGIMEGDRKGLAQFFDQFLADDGSNTVGAVNDQRGDSRLASLMRSSSTTRSDVRCTYYKLLERGAKFPQVALF